MRRLMQGKQFLFVSLALLIIFSGGVYLKMVNCGGQKKWHYQLQNYSDKDLETLSKYENTIFVIDYSKDGSEGNRFTKEEVLRLKNSGSNIVLSYMSIGEAEDYRWYFKDLNRGLLIEENKDWQGNHRVKFWQQEWQEIFLGDQGYLEKIISVSGYDGVYLDIVDAYLYHSDQKYVASQMLSFIRKISEKVHQLNPKGLVFPQNAPCIVDAATAGLSEQERDVAWKSYLSVVDGIGAESTFLYGPKRMNNEYRPQPEVIRCLKKFVDSKKTVLAVEYADSDRLIEKSLESILEHGYLGLVTDRDLKGVVRKYPNPK